MTPEEKRYIQTAVNTTISMCDVSRDAKYEARNLFAKALYQETPTIQSSEVKEHSLLLLSRMILLHGKTLGIDEEDKEILLEQLLQFLDPKLYQENIQVLQEHYGKEINYGNRKL